MRGPVKPPGATGKGPTPGPAAAPDNAARESTEVLDSLGAGVDQPSHPTAGARPGGPLTLGTGVSLPGATYTRARQALATDWAYSLGHDPDREGAGGWPPGPPPHPRPTQSTASLIVDTADALGLDPVLLAEVVVRRALRAVVVSTEGWPWTGPIVPPPPPPPPPPGGP